MVTVRDVTELRALEREAEGQKARTGNHRPDTGDRIPQVQEFVDTSVKYMAECRSLIEANQTKDLSVIASTFQKHAHRQREFAYHGLTYIAAVVHAVESTMTKCARTKKRPGIRRSCSTNWPMLKPSFAKYRMVNDEKLGHGGSSSSGLSLDPERLTGWINRIQSMTSDDLTPPVKGVVSEAYKMLMSF